MYAAEIFSLLFTTNINFILSNYLTLLLRNEITYSSEQKIGNTQTINFYDLTVTKLYKFAILFVVAKI